MSRDGVAHKWESGKEISRVYAATRDVKTITNANETMFVNNDH